jgi:hypothetical protein
MVMFLPEYMLFWVNFDMKHKLDNLILFVDYNRAQLSWILKEIMNIDIKKLLSTLEGMLLSVVDMILIHYFQSCLIYEVYIYSFKDWVYYRYRRLIQFSKFISTYMSPIPLYILFKMRGIYSIFRFKIKSFIKLSFAVITPKISFIYLIEFETTH